MRFPHLHKSTIVVGLIVALPLVLICIPGRITDVPSLSSGVFEHGWPFMYLQREAELDQMRYAFGFHSDPMTQLPMHGIPWLNADNWKFWEADPNDGTPRREFYIATMFADGLAAFALLAAIVAAWEYRRRRRSGLLAFSLPDMFVMVTVVCVILGWGAFQYRSFQHEKMVLKRNWETELFTIDDQACVAPLWIQALIGLRFMPAWTWRISSVDVWLYDDDLNELQNELKEFSYLTHIVLYRRRGEPSFQAFGSLPRITKLSVIEGSRQDDFPVLDSSDVPELSQLIRLKRLVISHKSRIAQETIHQLQDALPNCVIVDLDEDW